MNIKLKRQLSISITVAESDLLDQLSKKDVSIVAIFRRGLKHYSEDYIESLTQNNNA